MSVRAPALQLLELSLAKNLRNKAHVFVDQKRCAGPAAGDDSRAFLAAMLEREQSVIGQDRGIVVAEHAKKSALVLRIKCARLAVVDFVRRDHTKTSTKTEFIQTLD